MAHFARELREVTRQFTPMIPSPACLRLLRGADEIPTTEVQWHLRESVEAFFRNSLNSPKVNFPDGSRGTFGVESSASQLLAAFLWVCFSTPIGCELLRRRLEAVQPFCSPREGGKEPVSLTQLPGVGHPSLVLRTYRIEAEAAFTAEIFASQVLRRVASAALDELLHADTPQEIRSHAENLVAQHEAMYEMSANRFDTKSAWHERVKFGSLYLLGSQGVDKPDPNSVNLISGAEDDLGYGPWSRWLTCVNMMHFAESALQLGYQLR